jgi:hypothetical protein
MVGSRGKHMNKRAQMEIFGLAIIFVIFILGLLIFLKFSGDEPITTAEDFVMKQLPTRMLQTMMKTTTGCREQEVEVLVVDIASHVNPTPPDYCTDINVNSQINCNGHTSYEELFGIGNVVPSVFANSLDIEKKDYEFIIKMKGGCEIYAINSTNSCARANKISAETFYLTSNRGKVEMIMKVCENVGYANE